MELLTFVRAGRGWHPPLSLCCRSIVNCPPMRCLWDSYPANNMLVTSSLNIGRNVMECLETLLGGEFYLTQVFRALCGAENVCNND